MANRRFVASLMSENKLSSEISFDSINNWTQMVFLHVQNNLFIGKISPEIGLLSNLSVLFLYHKNFTGPIHIEIGNLENLRSLDLSNNQISGSIPYMIGNLVNLEDMNLNGTIPLE
ncbi:unnamed protein product [Lactuca virosa]|uniref:Leucine-rich repeat-containing N-terminal plant-type domain-containing protein n=1 Tax=Lactuca virosa TaxID=75947 RepID=A0AAU9MRB7_9ASTR|nr:unnamed protein product [Lactuca virosa]